MGTFYVVLFGWSAGERWTEDKAVGHFICTGLHRRVTPLCPGLARSPVTAPRRGNPKKTNKTYPQTLGKGSHSN